MRTKYSYFWALLYLYGGSTYANRYESDAAGGGYGGGGSSIGTLILWLIGAAITIYIYIKSYRLFSIGGIEPDLFDGDSPVFPVAVKLGLVALMSIPVMFIVANWFGNGGYVALVSPAIASALLGAFDAKRFQSSDIKRLNERNERAEK